MEAVYLPVSCYSLSPACNGNLTQCLLSPNNTIPLKIVLLFLCCSLLTTPMLAQWEYQNTGITNNLRGIYFLDETTGFAVGDAFAPSEAPILKTVDGGMNWILKPSDTPNPLRDVAFNTNVKGFACGFYGTLVKSNDTGETWEQVNLQSALDVNFRALDFPTKEVGYVAGSGGVFLKTTDVGVTWDSLNTGFSHDLLDIEFFTNDTGFATGSIGFSNGVILRTYDGGMSWESVYTSSQAIPALLITKNYKIYAGGGTSPNGGHEFILQSLDGGDTWEEIYTGPPGRTIRRGDFTTNTLIWFVDDAGSIIKTKDGGETWVVDDLNPSGLSSIFFTEEDTGYVAGGLGSIFKFTPCPVPLDVLAKIDGAKTVCHGISKNYSIAPISGANSYEWTVPPDASYVFLSGDTAIKVTFGVMSGLIKVVAGADCDTSISEAYITVIPPLQVAGSINGSADFCAGDTASYYISPIPDAITYTWTVPADASIVAQFDTMIVVAFGNTSGTISVTASDDCDQTSTSIPVTLQEALGTIGTISGDSTSCLFGLGSYLINSVANAFSYNWSLPAGASVIYSQGDTFVVVQFDTTGGDIGVTANGFCDTLSTFFTVDITGQLVLIDSLIGDTAVCEGTTHVYEINTIDGATSYQWTVPDDATILSGQGDTLIAVLFGSSSGEITIVASAADCNTYEASLYVQVTQLLSAPDDITGVTALCSGDTSLYIVSEVAGAESYLWEVPAGAILLAGQGQTLISVLFGDTSGNVVFSAISSCDTVTSTLFVFVEPPVPPIQAIIGDSTLCAGDTSVYYIPSVPGVDYSWAVPLDATIIATSGDTSITVVFGNNTGNITVFGGSVCAFQDTSLTVIVAEQPVSLTPIAGESTVCNGDTATYAIAGIPGFSYSWSVPADATIFSMQGDTMITVQFGNTSGDITVVAGSNCTSLDTFLSVVVISDATSLFSILGDTLVCSGDTANYSVAPVDGFSFSWSVPSDATIIASSGDTAITVVFGNTTGLITLSASGLCASPDTSLLVTVVAFPPVPVITFVDNNLISSEPEGNQWFYDGSPIAGATGQSYTPLVNGTYSVVVTYPPGCSTASDTFVVLSVSMQTIQAGQNIVVAPNPFDTYTMLQFTDHYQMHNGTLMILDMQGKQVSVMHQLNGTSIKIFRNGLPDGVYFFRLTDPDNNTLVTGKLFIQ